MFDSLRNRQIYEHALNDHDALMKSTTKNGQAYRIGYHGNPQPDDVMYSYEYWRAGKENARRHNNG